MMDRTTKILLALIAGGLWANAWPHLTGRASAQNSGDICVNALDCLQAISGWTAHSAHLLSPIAADMKLLVAKAQEIKAPVEPAAPIKPRATPAPPITAKTNPCISGASC
jgi:hypothetical protein